MEFNISPSSLNLWLSSELQFYYQYIVKAEPDTKLNLVYSLSGNIVHNGLERYHDNHDKEDALRFFDDEWKRNNLDSLRGFNGKSLDMEQYISAYQYGISLIDDTYDIIESEMRLEFPVREGINKKGYIDVLAVVDGKKVIVDWKTSSSMSDDDKFRIQTLFYAHLYWCKTGEFIDEARIEYLKLKKRQVYTFTVDEIVNFQERHIMPMLKTIYDNGDDASLYSLGEYDSPFNAHLCKCKAQEEARKGNDIVAYHKANMLYFPNGLPRELKGIIDEFFSYMVDGYQFTPQYKSRKWDGKKRFLKQNLLPYGFLMKLQELLARYNERAGKDFRLKVIDKRDRRVIEKTYDTKFIDSPFELRPYQEEAVKAMQKYKIMCLKSPTGTGKTVIAADFIKRQNKRSLFLVHRIELAQQTKDEFEKYLGIDVGIMTEGKLDIKNQVTISSIQTIAAILKRNDETTRRLRTYLYNVTVCIADEAQTVRQSGMYNDLACELRNVEYCIGISATPYRSGNDSIELYAFCGYPMHEVSAKDMVEKGYLAPMRVHFIDLKHIKDDTDYNDFHDNYAHHIVYNVERNRIIIDFVNKYKKDKKILVLVSRIEHGQYLMDNIPGSFFLHGTTPSDERKVMFKKFKDTRDLKVMISMASIASAGWNITDMQIIINCSANASSIQTIQAIGRVMRTSEGKTHGTYIDFIDYGVFHHASLKRMKQLREEGYKV